MARLLAAIEAGAICRQVETQGGFAAILRKGDAERGSLLLLVGSRGEHSACLERMLGPSGNYEWAQVGPDGTESGQKLAEFLENRMRFDEDLWLIDLDVAHPERFIAETIRTA
jgi:hypothetical protein